MKLTITLNFDRNLIGWVSVVSALEFLGIRFLRLGEVRVTDEPQPIYNRNGLVGSWQVTRGDQ